MPELIRVHPVGAAIAVGGDPDRVPYRSSDGGRTWLPVAVPPGESVRDLAFDAATGRLWLLTGAALLRMAAATGAIEEVRRWPAETGYERLGLSADGQAIWLLTPGAGMLRLSRDGGVTWRDVALASTGTPEPALVDVACGGDRGSCLALLEDGRLLSLADGATAANGEAGRLPEEARDSAGYLLQHGSPPRTIVVPEEGSRALVSADGGANWAGRGLGRHQHWGRPVVAADGSILVLGGDEAAVILGAQAGDWRTVVLEESGEWLAPCVLPGGEALYLLDEAAVAWTRDGGKTWQRTVALDTIAPWCGAGGGHLWLQLEGVRVFALER